MILAAPAVRVGPFFLRRAGGRGQTLCRSSDDCESLRREFDEFGVHNRPARQDALARRPKVSESEIGLLWIAHNEVLLRHRIAGRAERFANDFVGVEVNLPVMIGMTIGAHGEHRAVEIKLEDFDIRREIGPISPTSSRNAASGAKPLT